MKNSFLEVLKLYLPKLIIMLATISIVLLKGFNHIIIFSLMYLVPNIIFDMYMIKNKHDNFKDHVYITDIILNMIFLIIAYFYNWKTAETIVIFFFVGINLKKIDIYVLLILITIIKGWLLSKNSEDNKFGKMMIGWGFLAFIYVAFIIKYTGAILITTIFFIGLYSISNGFSPLWLLIILNGILFISYLLSLYFLKRKAMDNTESPLGRFRNSKALLVVFPIIIIILLVITFRPAVNNMIEENKHDQVVQKEYYDTYYLDAAIITEDKIYQPKCSKSNIDDYRSCDSDILEIFNHEGKRLDEIKLPKNKLKVGKIYERTQYSYLDRLETKIGDYIFYKGDNTIAILNLKTKEVKTLFKRDGTIVSNARGEYVFNNYMYLLIDSDGGNNLTKLDAKTFKVTTLYKEKSYNIRTVDIDDQRWIYDTGNKVVSYNLITGEKTTLLSNLEGPDDNYLISRIKNNKLYRLFKGNVYAVNLNNNEVTNFPVDIDKDHCNNMIIDNNDNIYFIIYKEKEDGIYVSLKGNYGPLNKLTSYYNTRVIGRTNNYVYLITKLNESANESINRLNLNTGAIETYIENTNLNDYEYKSLNAVGPFVNNGKLGIYEKTESKITFTAFD